MQNLHDLFIHELQDLYSAEKQILGILPKMTDSASNTMLKEGFKAHYKQTENQVKRLEKIQDDMGIDLEGSKCKGMEGLIKEGTELMQKDATPEAMDAALISAAQRVEHYEIAGYGTAITYAKLMKHKDAEKLLKETIDEEETNDKKLTELATSGINQSANEM